MTQAAIDKIIKEGTDRQKVLLCMTNAAYHNMNDGKALLPLEVYLELVYSIKAKRAIDYYEELKICNKGFLIYWGTAAERYQRLVSLVQGLAISKPLQELKSTIQKIVNDLLDLYPDSQSKAKALGYLESPKGELKRTFNTVKIEIANEHLRIHRTKDIEELKEIVDEINDGSETLKIYLENLKAYTAKKLPLKPYISAVKEREDWTKALLKKARKNLKETLGELSYEYMIRENQVVKLGEPLKTLVFPYSVTLYDEIETDEPTDDFLEKIRAAGI